MTETPVALYPFTKAARAQRRVTYRSGAVSNLATAGTLPVIPLTATGFIRKLVIEALFSYTTSASAAIVTGDSPWNGITRLSLFDSQGTPVIPPMSAYNLRLIQKYLPSGAAVFHRHATDPAAGPEYAFSASGTSGAARFRLELQFEEDERTGWGCIPNLDANASPQLNIDFGAHSLLFSGGTASAATVSVTVTQHYYAVPPAAIGGVAVQTAPSGVGDYLQTRYETSTVTPSAENILALSNRGGYVKGVIVVSRTAGGVRTALTGSAQSALVLDNVDIDAQVSTDELNDQLRRTRGFTGADYTTTYAPLTAGTIPGIDTGVLVLAPSHRGDGRDQWLETAIGSLFQARFTPGASASAVEIITQLAQPRDVAAFMARD